MAIPSPANAIYKKMAPDGQRIADPTFAWLDSLLDIIIRLDISLRWFFFDREEQAMENSQVPNQTIEMAERNVIWLVQNAIRQKRRLQIGNAWLTLAKTRLIAQSNYFIWIP